MHRLDVLLLSRVLAHVHRLLLLLVVVHVLEHAIVQRCNHNGLLTK